MRILGLNAVFHDPAAALVVDGRIVAAAEEERFTRRKHGHVNNPFAAWELPQMAAAWCLESAGLSAGDIDAVAYSYDPSLAVPFTGDVLAGGWDALRTLYAERAPLFLKTALPGIDPGALQYVPHHVAHAASAGLASPYRDCSVLVLDGRGEHASHLAGCYVDGQLEVLKIQQLPHSIGLLYEDITEHLGFLRSNDEYKVMALASYGQPRFLGEFRDIVQVTADGGFSIKEFDFATLVKKVEPGVIECGPDHADLASSMQIRLQEVLLELVTWLHAQTGDRYLTMAGGVALNCVANSYLLEHGPFEDIWIQPASSDSGTALGGALHLSELHGDRTTPMLGADLGRGWSDAELEAWLRTAEVPYTRPADLAAEVGQLLADNGVIAWFQGRAEYGPRALGYRSLLAHPGHASNLERMNDVKGREQFRPIAPMVLAERHHEIFEGGAFPSPYMLFTHRVKADWRDRIPAVVHVDGTARVQTVHHDQQPLLHDTISAFAARTDLPVVVNTSLNTAGRPIVDDPRDALELFGSAPVQALVLGPFLLRRAAMYS